MARIRSPNYPQIGLAPAIERVRMIYKAERQNRIDRDVGLKLMGFGGYNGASAGVLSAITKFGLLESVGDGELKVSDLAVRILVPHDDHEKAEALRIAAGKPPLFVELAERWPTDPPSDHSLRTYLTRRGFADSALEGVIKSYADTMALVRDSSPQYDPNPEDEGSDQLEQPGEEQAGNKIPAPIIIDVPAAAIFPVSDGPGLKLVRTAGGYIVHLSGTVLTKGHVDEVVTLLNALKASMPDEAPAANAATER